MTTKSAIQRACDVVGSQSELARRIGIRPQSVQQWIEKDHVPAERVVAVERATKGEVTRYELRPDLYSQLHRVSAA